MSRKLEIRTRMAELQKEFSSLNEEMEGIKKEEKAIATREKYKDYLFKVGVHSYKVEPEEGIQEATDSDREVANMGKSGMVYTGFGGHSDFGYVMMKDRSEYSRVVRVMAIIDAVEHLASDAVKDKEPYIKIILGEEMPQ
jgi:hypothetical protein